MKPGVAEYPEFALRYPEFVCKTDETTVPFMLAPALKDSVWGGTRLKTGYGKQSALPNVAESWELSAHADGESLIASGPFEGMTLGNYWAGHGSGAFPILLKLIDARDCLSVQVHPGDEYARAHEGEAGKTEMWVILECERGAFVYLGVERQITHEELRRRAQDGTLAEVLHKRPVAPGDVIFIPAGTIHAIGAGILLAEVQENSNATYRLYDYGRVGPGGQPRPLHLQKALAVARLTPAANGAPGAGLLAATPEYVLEQLADCAWFNVRRLTLCGRCFLMPEENSFFALLCVNGAVIVESENETLYVQKGSCVFVPAKAKGLLLRGAGVVIAAAPREPA